MLQCDLLLDRQKLMWSSDSIIHKKVEKSAHSTCFALGFHFCLYNFCVYIYSVHLKSTLWLNYLSLILFIVLKVLQLLEWGPEIQRKWEVLPKAGLKCWKLSRKIFYRAGTLVPHINAHILNQTFFKKFQAEKN